MSSSGAHFACNIRIICDGGEARCCECSPHKGCNMTMPDKTIILSRLKHLPDQELVQRIEELLSRFGVRALDHAGLIGKFYRLVEESKEIG